MWETLKSLMGGWRRSAQQANEERRIWVRRPCDLTAYFQSTNGQMADRQAAQVRDISRGGMNVVVKERFEPGAQLSVELPGNGDRPAFTVLACVVHALPHADNQWALGCSFADELTDDDLRPFGARRARTQAADQRIWERFPCRVEAKYSVMRAADPTTQAATVVNISANGVALQVRRAIDVGSLLNLQLRRSGEHTDLEILACVVRVTPQPNGEQLLGCNFISELDDKQIQGLF